MRRPFAHLAAPLALAFVVGCAGGGEARRAAADAEIVAEGQAIAARDCAACHAIGRSGDSPMAAAPPLRTLSQRYPVDTLQEAFAEGVLVGHPAMPSFVFSPEEVDALLAYLESVQGPEQP